MTWLARFAVAAVLIAAGVLKAADPVPVMPYHVPGGPAVTWMLLHLLPWIEIGAGLLLLGEWPLRWTAWPALLLYLSFVVATALRLVAEGTAPDCGCFGVLAAPLDRWHLAGNLALLALAGWLAWRARLRASPTP